ncbi:hypothetical protein I3843_14G111500 [Carya illinoinensis]|nr:hypothetical protein I3843_14G111500 [Carya illinoinensis]
MIWVLIMSSLKQIMGLIFRKELACFSLLLLVLFLFLLQISTSSAADHVSATFATFKAKAGSAASKVSSIDVESINGSIGSRDKDHEDAGDHAHVFGDEKRKVFTGPNPLHNR